MPALPPYIIEPIWEQFRALLLFLYVTILVFDGIYVVLTLTYARREQRPRV